jgi:hypothetical protein
VDSTYGRRTPQSRARSQPTAVGKQYKNAYAKAPIWRVLLVAEISFRLDSRELLTEVAEGETHLREGEYAFSVQSSLLEQ